MSSKDPGDPRPDSQVEAEDAMAEEQVREIVPAEGEGRGAEAESAAAYAEAGIIGAPGSEVETAAMPERKDTETRDKKSS